VLCSGRKAKEAPLFSGATAQRFGDEALIKLPTVSGTADIIAAKVVQDGLSNQRGEVMDEKFIREMLRQGGLNEADIKAKLAILRQDAEVPVTLIGIGQTGVGKDRAHPVDFPDAAKRCGNASAVQDESRIV
jgi:hypothetical protein